MSAEERKVLKDKSSIPNSGLETMFLRIATDHQIQMFYKHVGNGDIDLASAYATNITVPLFMALVEDAEVRGEDIEELNNQSRKKKII